MLSQKEIEDLRLRTKEATAEDIGAEWKGEADPDVVEDLAAYLSNFAARKRDTDGALSKGNPCIVCDMPLQGDLMQQLIGDGGFIWGLVHGQGHCRKCHWPATAYHFVKDRHGKEMITFRHVVLQVHPKHIEVRKRVE